MHLVGIKKEVLPRLAEEQEHLVGVEQEVLTRLIERNAHLMGRNKKSQPDWLRKMAV